MRNFSFDNKRYLDMLNAQVLHMDQGACYNPEYLATRNMRDYPSRVAQIIRAVHLGELPATPHGAATVFRSILSGQGERWQNFGEDFRGYILSQLLGRELFANAGLAPEYIPLPAPDAATAAIWSEAIPTEETDAVLFVDEASFLYAADSARALGDFLSDRDLAFSAYGPYDTGFSGMAHGRLEEGIEKLKTLLEGFANDGIRNIVTVSGLGRFVLEVLAPELGIPCPFEIVDVLDLAEAMETTKAHVYGGSFYTRYLRQGPHLAALTPNREEEPVSNAREFQPLLRGDRRVNVPNIWGTPICAEFNAPEIDVADAIFADAAAQIAKSSHAQLVVCDPYAYTMLREKRFEAAKLTYFWQVLR